MSNPELISDDYRSLNARLHETSEEYGNRNNFLARELPTSIAILRKLFSYTSVLDYGCGKGLILESLNKKLKPLGMDIQGYDPCVEKYSGPPKPADILLCTDVLEHVEPEKTEEVLRHIRSLTLNVSYLIIDLLPAAKRLPDGRNAHINLNTAGWWLNALSDSFPFSLQYLSEKREDQTSQKIPVKKLVFVGAKSNSSILAAMNLFSATHASAETKKVSIK